MGTGSNHNGQRCGHCARDPLRQARCTCTGTPPAAATAAMSIDGAVEAMVDPTRRDLEDLEFHAVLVASDLTEAGWPTDPENAGGRLQTLLPGGAVAETAQFVPGDGALTRFENPSALPVSRSRFVVTYRADAERLGRTFGSIDDPTPIGDPPPGVPAEVWRAASPDEPMRIETGPDGTETLLWEVEGNVGYDPDEDVRVAGGWLRANALTGPRSSVIAVANRALLRFGDQIPGDATVRTAPGGGFEFAAAASTFRLDAGGLTKLEGEL